MNRLARKHWENEVICFAGTNDRPCSWIKRRHIVWCGHSFSWRSKDPNKGDTKEWQTQIGCDSLRMINTSAMPMSHLCQYALEDWEEEDGLLFWNGLREMDIQLMFTALSIGTWCINQDKWLISSSQLQSCRTYQSQSLEKEDQTLISCNGKLSITEFFYENVNIFTFNFETSNNKTKIKNGI